MKMGYSCGPGSFDACITGHDVRVPGWCSLEGTRGISWELVALRMQEVYCIPRRGELSRREGAEMRVRHSESRLPTHTGWGGGRGMGDRGQACLGWLFLLLFCFDMKVLNLKDGAAEVVPHLDVSLIHSALANGSHHRSD